MVTEGEERGKEMEREEEQTKTREEIEGEITRAMRARVSDFKAQADSLTLEGVRRALEKDLGMETLSLDVHKRFIKQCLEECFDGPDENTDKDLGKTKAIPNQQEREESEVLEQSEDMKNSTAAVDEQAERPALDEDKPAGHDEERVQAKGHHNDLSEDVIKKAIKKRVSYFRANLESISLQQVRRMLEEDLKLERKALDAYKSFIGEEIELILRSPKATTSKNEVKKNIKKLAKKADEKKSGKASKRAHEGLDFSDISDSRSDNDNGDADDIDDEEVKPKKIAVEKSKLRAKGPKRQKKIVEEKRQPSSKGGKSSEPDIDKGSDEGRDSSEDDHSRSPTEEGVKKKQEKSTQVYGKQVEHLKSIIKSCGIGIPPTVYRRVKQAPESKREAYLIKELKQILEKEGLSTNPSEKEIKEAKKRKERAKELEGIDMSNIISSSRRKNTTTYIPPPKLKIEDDSDDDDDEEAEDEDNEDDEDNEENMDTCDNLVGDASEGSAEDAEDELES